LSGPAQGSGFALEAPVPGDIRIREVFPSDTYARAQGMQAQCSPRARDVLTCLVSAPWKFEGNRIIHSSSVPTKSQCVKLLAHRTKLASQLAHGEPLKAMHKIPRDPSWADLWDAFTCAFVVACEAAGCARLAGSNLSRIREEGAILVPELAW
jgi:hypothetical protein